MQSGRHFVTLAVINEDLAQNKNLFAFKCTKLIKLSKYGNKHISHKKSF